MPIMGNFKLNILFSFLKAKRQKLEVGQNLINIEIAQHFLNRILSFQTWKMGQPKSNMLPRLNCRNGHQPSKLNLNPILFYFRTGNTWLQFVDLHLFDQQIIIIISCLIILSKRVTNNLKRTKNDQKAWW